MKSVFKTHPLWKRGVALFAAFAMLLAMLVPSAPAARADEPQPKPIHNELPADMLVDNNTGKGVLDKKHQDEMTFTGTLDVSKIKDQMQETEDEILRPAQGMIGVDAIMLDKTTVQSEFKATLTLPEGLEFTDQSQSSGDFNGGESVFTPSWTIDKKQNTATVTFTLTDSSQYDTYLKLKKAINGVENKFTFSVSHVKFAAGASADTPYVATGVVEGNMKAKAYADVTLPGRNTPLHIEKQFAFTWNGVQTAAEAYNQDTSQIAAAVRYTDDKNTDYVKEIPLLGDIKVGNETQNKRVYSVKKSDKIAFTGTLNVQPVKDQLKEVENKFNPNGLVLDDMIELSDYEGEFTTTLTLPAEMDFDPATDPTVTLNGAPGYQIEGTPTISGKTITITMRVDKDQNAEGIQKPETFKDLKDAVNGMTNELQVTVDGVKFNNMAVRGKNYTVKGTMTGKLKATATVAQVNKSLGFDLSWNADQDPAGRDSTKPKGTTEITFTVRIPKPYTPPTPGQTSSSSSSSSSSVESLEPEKPVESEKSEKPVEPEKPVESEKPVEPEKPSSEKPVTPKPNSKPVAPKTGDISAALYAGSAIISTAGVAVLFLKKNKRNEK